MPLVGKQTWRFPSTPRILSAASVVGNKEGQGPLGNDFDIVHKDPYVGTDSWEKAERKLTEEACEEAMRKAGLKSQDIDLVIAGDLLNQLITSSFAARTLAMPFLGIFGACSTSMQGLALAALLVDSGFAHKVIAATSSHNSTAERQFRFPTEYGGQKPPTAHCTVTGSGAALIGKNGSALKITHATIGKVIDLGVKNPWEMGAAMAPAAVDTITAHFRDTGRTLDDYDLILTGDLGRVGHSIAKQLLEQQGHQAGDKFHDCGVLIYYPDQEEVFSGGSGCACCAVVTYGHILKRMERGELKRVLVTATGALLSPTSTQQGESIPCIAHTVAIEREDDMR
jgi:stage V sporulation protein AD